MESTSTLIYSAHKLQFVEKLFVPLFYCFVGRWGIFYCWHYFRFLHEKRRNDCVTLGPKFVLVGTYAGYNCWLCDVKGVVLRHLLYPDKVLTLLINRNTNWKGWGSFLDKVAHLYGVFVFSFVSSTVSRFYVKHFCRSISMVLRGLQSCRVTHTQTKLKNIYTFYRYQRFGASKLILQYLNRSSVDFTSRLKRTF